MYGICSAFYLLLLTFYLCSTNLIFELLGSSHHWQVLGNRYGRHRSHPCILDLDHNENSGSLPVSWISAFFAIVQLWMFLPYCVYLPAISHHFLSAFV